MPPSQSYRMGPTRREFLRGTAGLGALLAMAGCGPSTSPPGDVPIVMVVLDTVRAANCGAWGYGKNTTPHLDALAAEGTRYGQAISPAPWTLPAHVSLFTGQYTMDHGVRGYIYRDEQGKRRVRENALSEEAVTLAEHLYSAGYATGVYSANTGFMAPHYQLAQGFETYHLERIPGVELMDKALAWLGEQERTPFLFCNVMDAHRPYNLSPCQNTLPEAVSEDTTLLETLRVKTLSAPESLDTNLAALVTGQYDRGVANADKALGRLIAGLKEQGLYDQALLIVCADHGEYLGEHGLVEHSKDIFQEAVHVPLVVKAPFQREPSQIDHTVSLTQVPTTVLAHAGVAAAAMPPPLEVYDQNYPILSENYYSRDWDVTDPRWPGRFDRVRTACYMGDWKFIHSSDGDDALYALESDPGERNNLRQENQERFAALRAECLKHLKRPGPPTSEGEPLPELSEAQKEELRALGYLE